MPLCIPSRRCQACWHKSAEFLVESGHGNSRRKMCVCAEKSCIRFAVYGAEIFSQTGTVTISSEIGPHVATDFDNEVDDGRGE